MKILIAAIGKARPGSPELQLYADYVKRLSWKVECKEFDIRHSDDRTRNLKENEQLLAACKPYERLVALDESGKTLSSREFAQTLKGWQQQSVSSVAFIIGGSDGLLPDTLKAAQLVWSFGRVTWPHLLMRALLAEQLYRAHSIMAGHPYHRDG